MSAVLEATMKNPELATKRLKKLQAKLKKRGVVYLSRIPPYMKPAKIRHLLEKHGEINRVYLAPEDETLRQKRKKKGGNTRKLFTEGWVEFEDKKVAKNVAEMLNNRMIGGKKSSYYREDIWNIRYLSKFKWEHLTEKNAYEKRIREQRLKMEISQARREDSSYLDDVDQAKRIEHAKKKAKKSAEKKRGQTNQLASSTKASQSSAEVDRIRRTFKQKTPISSDKAASAAEAGMLTKIFKKKRKRQDE